MQSIQDNLQDLKKCIVAIRNSIGDNIVGTGVIVTNDGLIITCYHVIEDEKNGTIFKTLHVSFPSAPYIKGHADILEEHCNYELDIAFLKLRENLPEQTIVANLSESIEDGHEFKSFGFRKPLNIEGLNAAGKIRGTVNKKSSENTGQELIQLYSNEIGPGMSGAPVLDKEINRVVGIVSEYYRSQTDVDNNLSFAIPVQSIIKVYPELKHENPGLKPIFNFLTKVGLESSRLYEKIDELFIPPLEYEEIKETLREKRIVFITGEQEYGKTYTAFHILWEYYNSENRYEPKHVQTISKEEGNAILDKLQRIDTTLNHKIIYFEDPFGTTNYESNKKFEDNIGRVIENLKLLDSVYIIITSRDNVFGEFESNKTTEIDLESLRKDLNINSYDYKKRQEMLFAWAAALDCEWIHHDDLRDIVTKSIEHVNKLPTSLNIRDFVIATIDIHDKRKLLKILDEKSEETAKSFAKEVKAMSKDKILFFSFLFISGYFWVDFVKNKYQELANGLHIKIDEWKFDRTLRQFERGGKIDVKSGHIKFSHPSYYEALPFLLLEDQIPTKINTKYFSKVLINLAEDKDAAWYVLFDVARAVSNNFDKLPENVRNILFKLADNKEAAQGVAGAVASNFDKLPEDVRNILFKLADNKEAAGGVASVVSSNFDKLPENVRDSLLLKLADNNAAARNVAFAVEFNFDKLLENVRDSLLLKLADNNDAAESLSRAVTSNFDKLPEKVQSLLFKLANDNKAAGGVARAVGSNFDKLPENVRDSLLLKLADNNAAAYDVANALASNFDKLPENVRKILFKLANEKYAAIANAVASNFDKLPEDVRNILFKLADNKEAASDVVYAVVKNFRLLQDIANQLLVKLVDDKHAAIDVAYSMADIFDKLPEDVRNSLLVKLADNNDATMYVTRAVGSNFDKLPENVRDSLLLKLADNNAAAYDVANVVASNFDKLPEKAQSLLFKLANDNKAAGGVARAVGSNFDKLPENVRDSLLLKLADNNAAAYDVANALASNFDKLPENVRKILFKLADNKEAAGGVASVVDSNFDKLPENVRNSLLLKLADNNAAARYVAFAVTSNFDKLPEDVRNMLFKLADNKEAAESLSRAVASNFDKLPEDVRNILFKLADNKEAAGYTAYAVQLNFDKLPESTRNQLLLKLAKEAPYTVASVVTNNFDKVPDHIRNELLKRIADNITGNIYAARSTARAVVNNFDKLPDDVRNGLLLKLADNKAAAKVLSPVIYKDFNKLPENVKKELQKRLEKHGI